MSAERTLRAVLARAATAGLMNDQRLYREADLLAAATQIDNPPAHRRAADKETDHA